MVIVALGISLALTAIQPIWLATRGLKGVSPLFVEVFSVFPLNRWVFGLVLAALFVTAAARRMVPTEQTPVPDPRSNWRRRTAAYYHEYRLLALLVAAAIVCREVHQWLVVADSLVAFFGPRTWTQILEGALETHLTDPRYQLWLAVFCLAVYRAIFGFARRSDGLGSARPELPLSLFAIVWTVLLATLLMAVPIFAALGFGLCLNWWRLPL